MTYPNLKRYRQKSEPNIKLKISNSILNNDISFSNINCNENQINYATINNINNNNLSKFKTLEKKIINKSSTKRKIKNLINKQNNPELKEILSNLEIIMNKFPKNEERKENYLSTLPANNFSPIDTFIFEDINYNHKKLNLKYNINNYKYKKSNDNKKMEKFRSTLNDFNKIINGKNKIQNKNDNKYSYQSRISSNLYPVNNVKDNIFTLEI